MHGGGCFSSRSGPPFDGRHGLLSCPASVAVLYLRTGGGDLPLDSQESYTLSSCATARLALVYTRSDFYGLPSHGPPEAASTRLKHQTRCAVLWFGPTDAPLGKHTKPCATATNVSVTNSDCINRLIWDELSPTGFVPNWHGAPCLVFEPR